MDKNCSCRCGPFKVSLIPPGVLKPLILKILEDNPMHGYEIMNEISLRTQGYWRPTAGSIYPALGSLEKDRYVERREIMQGERARQMYTITDLGRETIKDMAQFSESWKNGLNKLIGLL